MSGGSAPSTQTSTQVTDLPEWAKPYAKESLGKAAALTDTAQNPYQAYTKDRIAGFNELQKQAFTGAENMAPSAELGQAGGIAGAAAMGALNTGYRAARPTNFYQQIPGYAAEQYGNQFQAPGQYQTGEFTSGYTSPEAFQAQAYGNMFQAPGQYRTGQFNTQSFTQPGSAEQYMSPYMQSVVDVQKREAQRASDIQRTQDLSAATKSGAFGGGRQAIIEAERQRNLGQQLGDIQATGSQAAFQAAQAQFNQEQAARQQAQQMREQSRQFGAGQGMTAAQAAAQYGLAGAQLGSQERQFGYGQEMTAADLAARYGQSAQQALEQSRQFGAGQGMTAAQAAAQYGLSGQQLSEQAKQYGYGQAANQAQLAAQYGLSGAQLAEQSRQYGAGLGMQGLQTALTGAGQLANIGQQGFAQQMDINKLQQQYGTQQQQLAQAQKTQQYEDFLNQQRYPYQQLEFMSNILRGTPMGTVSSLYAPGVSGAAQTIGTLGSAYSLGQGLGAFAAGGEVKGYAKGGTSVANPYELQDAMDALPDEGVDRMARVPGITALAKMQIEAEQAARNKMRAAFAAQQAQQQQPQMTVAEEMMSQLDQGLGGAPLPDDFMSAQGDSGIVAMAGGGDPEIERLRARSEAQRNTIIPGTSGASPGTARNTDPTGTVKPAATAGGIFGPLRTAQDEYEANTREGLAAWEGAQPDINLTKERHLEGLRAAGEYGTDMEAMLNKDAEAAEAELTKDRWLTMSEAFAKMASTPGTFMQSLAEGLGMGAKEIRGINKDYAKLERERNKEMGLIKEKRRAEEMGLVDKAAEYDRKIADQQLAIEDKRLEIGEKLAASGVNVEKAIAGYNTQLQQASINKGTGGKQSSAELRALQTSLTQELNKLVGESKNIFNPTQKAEHQAKIDDVSARLRGVQAQLAELGGMPAESTSTAGGLTTQGGRPVPAGGQKVYDFGSI